MIYKEANAVALARLPASRTFPPYRLKTDASCNPTALQVLPRTPVSTSDCVALHPSLALSRSCPYPISNATSSARCTPLASTRLHFSPVLVPSARFLAFPRPAPSAGTSKTHIHPEYSLFSVASIAAQARRALHKVASVRLAR
ncbi:hypothetical protein B0H13DRAFT_2378835 [Mycena leptocephala]|nr:hypothetical protein B0H13DRAFT_2378835 [Mycena leptocephala]